MQVLFNVTVEEEGDTADVSSEPQRRRSRKKLPSLSHFMKHVLACQCMARVAEFMQVNSESRGLGRLARFVDVCIEIQSELDKTATTASHHQLRPSYSDTGFRACTQNNNRFIHLEVRSHERVTLEINYCSN
jgi:hypothetical protein